MTRVDLTPLGAAMHAMGSRQIALLHRIYKRCEIEPNGDLGSPCWLWQGLTSGKPNRGRKAGRGHSYPRMNMLGCTVAVHRITWQCVFGPIPPRRQLDHLCRNRLCVSPLHCEDVTHRTNQKRKPK